MTPDPTPPSGGNPSEPTINVELNPTRPPGFAAVVRLCGEHDLATKIELHNALAALHGNVLVDLSSCEFVDSTTIAVLLASDLGRKADGHRLELILPVETTHVRRTLDVSGVTQLLTVHTAPP